MTAPYRDPTLPVTQRVQDLLDRMTLAEKLAQMGSTWVFEIAGNGSLDETRAAKMLEHGIGQVTRVGGGSNLGPDQIARLSNEIQSYLVANTRLGIPAILHDECLDGFLAKGATSFPQALGVAASWDPDLAEVMGAVIRRQMRATGVHQGLAPVLDISRDPRWGRIEETYGEDPYLTAAMGCGLVRGLQGKSLADGVAATAKHYVGHGAPEGGMNAAPPHIGERELRDVHLRPFEAIIREGRVATVMHAYHELDGIPTISNRWLLDEVLRNELGFEGVVVSDYNGVEELVETHGIAEDLGSAAAMVLTAGVDLELPSTASFGQPLERQVREERVDEALIDRAVARILDLKFRLGLFDSALVDSNDPGRGPVAADAALASRVAARTVVLAHHRNEVLPLRSTGTIAVIGPSADDGRNLLADYSHQAHIELLIESRKTGENPMHADVPAGLASDTNHIETMLDAIRSRAPEAEVRYAAGGALQRASDVDLDAAVAACDGADVAVVVVGERSGLTDDCTCGEARDRLDLGLPGRQEELVERVAATGVSTVVLVIGGRPLALERVAEVADAVLLGWVPGEHGAKGMVAALFGDSNPGGKLPITFPRSVGQIPTYYRHHPTGGRSRWKGRYADGDNRPLWPFGHGLSYTTFEMSNLTLDRAEVQAEGVLEIALEVANTGEIAGDEVVQLYLRDVRGSVTRPVKQLEGFARVSLDVDSRARVLFRLPIAQLAFHDVAMRRVVEPGTWEVMVGNSSEHLPLRASFEVTGETTPFARPPILGKPAIEYMTNGDI